MSAVSITCDRQDNLWLAAIWRGRELVDLHLDRFDLPDLSGAIVGGKIIRVLPAQREVYVDCGLEYKVYVSGLDKPKAGDYLVLRITSSVYQGKAWGGTVLSPNAVAHDFEEIGIGKFLK